ncbi:hypothetical protein DFH09DRAFT_1075938 [Mycena vulgaris]|nr:hypothetical protein DFH09DRAFT_1075938 [Mycena vulgaris]
MANPPTTIDAALRRAEHASAAARASAEEYDRTVADLGRAVEALRTENAALKLQIAASSKGEDTYRRTVTKLEASLTEERARAMAAEAALKAEREAVARDLAQAEDTPAFISRPIARSTDPAPRPRTLKRPRLLKSPLNGTRPEFPSRLLDIETDLSRLTQLFNRPGHLDGERADALELMIDIFPVGDVQRCRDVFPLTIVQGEFRRATARLEFRFIIPNTQGLSSLKRGTVRITQPLVLLESGVKFEGHEA